MSVSTVSSSSVQALLKLAQLRAASTTTASSASSTTASTEDTVAFSADALWLSQTQGTDPLRSDLSDLGDLLSSGDVDGARSAFASIQQKLAQGPGGTDGGPLGTTFSALGTALDSGDTAAIQKAWDALQDKLKTGPSQGGGPRAGQDPFQQDLQALGSLVSGGDLEGARKAYAEMTEKMKQGPGGTSPDTSWQDLSEALDAGDLQAASTALATFPGQTSGSGGTLTAAGLQALLQYGRQASAL